jgi:hypothetical protein
MVVSLRDRSFEETLSIYLSLCSDGDGSCADTPALALREQARAGRLGDAHVEPLILATEMAPNALCVGHLAKALAAFGRGAQDAAPALADQLAEMIVANDTDYWSFDGCIWALGYLGGPVAETCVRELAKERPSRAVRSQSIYRGRMTKEQRAARFATAIEGAERLLAATDPGVWRQSFMQVARPDAEVAAPKLSGRAWEVRSAAP